MVLMTLEEVFKKVVFLLGAGASKDAGCKLSSEMLHSLKEAINNLSATEKEFIKYKEDFNEIYHFILASLKYQSTMRDTSTNRSFYVNIEDFVMVLRQLIDKEFVIPYPLIGNWNDKILKWELRNGDIFDRFKNFITLLLVNDWTRFDSTKAESMMLPIRQMLNQSDPFKLNIFSLNYDLIFESVFNSPTEKILDNGFSEKINPEKENKIRYWAADFNDANSPTKINLYKLHGSIDWEHDQESEEILIKENINDDREPLMIFGSFSKMLSFDPFLYILSNFRSLLEEATIFVVIGYSFHDKYINNLLIQQLSQNTEEDIPKKLLIVNPSVDEFTEAQFAEELKIIQDSKSINDIINFRQISPERIKLIPKPASEFYTEYFANGAEVLKIELEQTEKGDKIFE
jgi:SIR2-like domain